MNRSTRESKARRRYHGGGYPPFKPSALERKMVSQLAGLKVGWEEMRKLIINPRTGQPIAKTSFARVFAAELEQARAKLKALVSSGFHAALAKHEPWALRLAMKNVYGWSLETGTLVPALEDEGQQQRRIKVEFVVPDPKPLPPPRPIDVVPEAKPNYSRPALPAPPPRRQHPLGWLE
jgi:hypothetical protein